MKKNISRKYITDKLNNSIENCLCEIYGENNIETGDITPEQSLVFDNLIDSFADLFEILIAQNNKN